MNTRSFALAGDFRLHDGAKSEAQRSSRHDGDIVRLAMLPVEQIFAAQRERESAKNALAHACAKTSHAAVLQPVVAQFLTNQLRIGLRGIRERSGERDTIVIDPVP